MTNDAVEKLAREWLVGGGGIRAMTVTGEGLVGFLAAYGEYLTEQHVHGLEAARNEGAAGAFGAAKGVIKRHAVTHDCGNAASELVIRRIEREDLPSCADAIEREVDALAPTDATAWLDERIRQEKLEELRNLTHPSRVDCMQNNCEICDRIAQLSRPQEHLAPLKDTEPDASKDDSPIPVSRTTSLERPKSPKGAIKDCRGLSPILSGRLNREG